MAESKGGTVIDFASGKKLDKDELEQAQELYGSPEFMLSNAIEELMPAASKLVGTHRGALAGLADPERDRLIDEYLARDVVFGGEADDEVGDFDDETGEGDAAPASLMDLLGGLDPLALMLEQCESGPVRTKLSDLLMMAPLDWIQDVSADFGIGDFKTTSRKKAASRLATAMGQDVDMFERALSGLTEAGFSGIRRVVEAGGTLVVPDSEVRADTLRDLPVSNPPLLFVFHRDPLGEEGEGAFSFVVADELVALADRIDWDAAALPIAKRARLTSYLATAVSMRGIVSQDDLIDSYIADVPDGFGEDGLILELAYALGDSNGDVWALLTPDDAFFISDIIADVYLGKFPECEPEGDAPIIDGELDESMCSLLDLQEEYEPAPIGAEALDAPNYLEWLAAFPSAVALRAFMDEHVPDGEDDYFFADNFVESIQMLARQPVQRDDYRLVVERLYPVDDPDLLVRAYELALAVVEDVPRWDLNGWSMTQARDLVEVEE